MRVLVPLTALVNAKQPINLSAIQEYLLACASYTPSCAWYIRMLGQALTIAYATMGNLFVKRDGSGQR